MVRINQTVRISLIFFVVNDFDAEIFEIVLSIKITVTDFSP